MAQYVDRPLPELLELPRLQDPRPRHRGTENLRSGASRKGVQNKICRDLKEGLLQSAILHGFDGAGENGLIGFCLHLAKRHPKAHCSLLAKLLPFNLNANVASPTISSVNILAVPPGVHLSHQQLAAVQQGEPLVLDHEQTIEAPPAAEAPIEVQSSEEEERVIADLKAEIRELSQKMGFPCVV